MQNSLFFKIKDTVDVDKHRLLEILFKDWVDGSCDNKVHYRIERNTNLSYNEVFRVDFEKQEDAVVMSLKGVPREFQMYLEIVK